MTNQRAMLLIVFAVIVFTTGSAMAGKRQCAEDYRRFCSQWGLEREVSKTACAATAILTSGA